MGISTKRNYHYIYLTHDKKYDKYYCGKRSCECNINEDWYYGSGNIIRKIINKYSKEEINNRLEKTILHISENYDENCKMEEYFINKFKATEDKNFYNIAKGGHGGNLISGYSDEKKKEIYKKIGNSNKGKILSTDVKIKISKGGKGLTRSSDTRMKISQSKIGEGNSFYGKKHSKESLIEISEKLKDANNPRAKMCIVVDKNENILFKGIRKEVFTWLENNNICSQSTMKKRLKDGKSFNPKYNTKNNYNSLYYDGIRFLYE